MLQALQGDLVAAGMQVTATVDAALTPPDCGGQWCAIEDMPQLERTFAREVPRSEWTIVIAPEIDGQLAQWCERVRKLGGKLLACSPATIELCSDKQSTAERLQAHGVPVAPGMRLPGEMAEFSFPAVLKPVDGAGSCDVHWVESPTDVHRLIQHSEQMWRLERYLPGIAASVSLLCGPQQIVALPPARQVLQAERSAISDADRFRYCGGEIPLPTSLSRRATQLAAAAIDALDAPLGWLGVDLVLGPAEDGSQDAVVEINPRLTTSYVGLRAVCLDNLARALIDIADGQPPVLRFANRQVRFDTEGNVSTCHADPIAHHGSEARV